MSSRASRNLLAACAAITATLAGTPPARAQQDSINAQVDSVVAQLDARARAQLDSAGGLPIILALGGGRGALHSPCESCSGTGTSFQVAAGIRMTRGLTLILEQGAVPGSDSEDPGISWTTMSVRIQPAAEAGFFLQAGAGRVHASRQHTYTEEYTDLSSCDWTWFIVIPVPTNCASAYRTETEYLRTSGPVVQLGVGYELALGRGKAIVPELRVMPGHAGMSGFSLAMHFGGSGALLRRDEAR